MQNTFTVRLMEKLTLMVRGDDGLDGWVQDTYKTEVNY